MFRNKSHGKPAAELLGWPWPFPRFLGSPMMLQLRIRVTPTLYRTNQVVCFMNNSSSDKEVVDCPGQALAGGSHGGVPGEMFIKRLPQSLTVLLWKQLM